MDDPADANQRDKRGRQRYTLRILIAPRTASARYRNAFGRADL